MQQSSRKSEAEAPLTVLIKKGHKGHHRHHGGAWKVAYADFVTAMMAFFLLLWLLSQSNEVKQAVGGYFREPIAFSSASGGTGLLEGVENVAVVMEDPTEPRDGEAEERARIESQMREKVQEILAALYENPELSELTGQIEVEITPEGLLIQLMESGNATFFDVGGATLSGPGRTALETVATAIASLDLAVVLEGHTDARPYASRTDYSNWELSSDRANTARRVLEESGVDPKRIKAVRGYSDTRLRFPDEPLSDRNRRIAILVLNRSSRTTGGDGLPESLPVTPSAATTH